MGAEDLKSTFYPLHVGFVGPEVYVVPIACWFCVVFFIQMGWHPIPGHEYPFALQSTESAPGEFFRV